MNINDFKNKIKCIETMKKLAGKEYNPPLKNIVITNGKVWKDYDSKKIVTQVNYIELDERIKNNHAFCKDSARYIEDLEII